MSFDVTLPLVTTCERRCNLCQRSHTCKDCQYNDSYYSDITH